MALARRGARVRGRRCLDAATGHRPLVALARRLTHGAAGARGRPRLPPHRNATAGVAGGHPFLQDLELVELVLSLPPELAFDPELDRALLRSSMRGLVPDAIRLRSEKSFFTPLFVEALDGPDRACVVELLDAPDAAIRAYTRPEVVRRVLLEAPPERRGGHWAWAVWRLVMLECWLRGESAA